MDLESSSHAYSVPVTHSILAADSLGTLVAQIYALEPPLTCTLLRHSWNDTYQLQTASNCYIVRVFGTSRHSLPAIQYELDLLVHLAEHGAPVAAPIASPNSGCFTTLYAPEGPRYLALFPYAPGSEPPIPIGNRDQSYHFGRALATIHTAADSFRRTSPRSPYDLTALLDQSLMVVHPFLTHRSADWEYLITVADDARRRLSPLLATGLDWGIIHGDPFSANARITDDHRVTWYDFDLCAPGWRALDLADAYASASDHGAEHEAIWHAFLAGYRTQRYVGENDLAAIPFLMTASVIWSMSINVTKGPIQGFECVDDTFFDSRLEWVRQSVDFYQNEI